MVLAAGPLLALSLTDDSRLIAASAIVGVCELFFDMSSQAILPAIVDEKSLELANSRLYISQIISNGFIGLPFGAWLFVVASGAPFAVNALALVVAAFLIRSIDTCRVVRSCEQRLQIHWHWHNGHRRADRWTNRV